MKRSYIPFNAPPYLCDAQCIAGITDYLNDLSTPVDCSILLKNLLSSPCYQTKSCTHSLELIAKLVGFSKGDEVIMPAFGFPSMASAFLSAGAQIIFADSGPNHPNIDPHGIEKLITSRTKALVILHYGGCPCDMNTILSIVKRYNLILIEDAAHAIGSYWEERHLGTIGDYGAISFHRTKNVSCEEGGLLIVKDPEDEAYIHSLCDKGTNLKDFTEGLVDSYEWVSQGSAYRLPDILAALLVPQLSDLKRLTKERLRIWDQYYEAMEKLQQKVSVQLPARPKSHNAHIFHFTVESREERTALQDYLQKRGIQATFHYQSLSESKMAISMGIEQVLDNAQKYQERLLRLPMHKAVTPSVVEYIMSCIHGFYKQMA